MVMKQLNTATHDGYQYRHALEAHEIRLLRCIGRDEYGNFGCQLISHSLDSVPAYSALSYAWGSIRLSKKVHCDGQLLKVTESAFLAITRLFDLGLINANRPVWIDAVCINQKDASEKTYQVRSMQDIYEGAGEVLVWLGEWNHRDRHGVKLMKRLYQIMLDCGRGIIETLDQSTAMLLGLPNELDKNWDSFLGIYTKDWFTRAWIVQETVRAKKLTFVCGTHIFPSRMVLDVFAALWQSKFYQTRIYGARFMPRQTGNAITLCTFQSLKRQYKTLRLLYCLHGSRNFAATDRRDKVFAMLSMCESQCLKLIDYNKLVETVMLDVVKYLFQNEPFPLDVLTFATYQTKIDNLPSWVPDWTSRVYANSQPATTLQPAAQIQSTGVGEQKEFYHIDADNGLVVHGCTIVDSLSSVTEGMIPLWDEWVAEGRDIRTAESLLSGPKSSSDISSQDEAKLHFSIAWSNLLHLARRLIQTHTQALALALAQTQTQTHLTATDTNTTTDINDPSDLYWSSLEHGTATTTSLGRSKAAIAQLTEILNRPDIDTSVVEISPPPSTLDQRSAQVLHEIIPAAPSFNWRNRGRRMAITSTNRIA